MYDDAVMKAFFSEYRSVTFQCNSSVTSSSSIEFSKINSFIGKDHVMAPQQQDPLPKTSEQISESEQATENRASPVSSLGGTSMDSSSPLLTNEASSENNQNYDMRHSRMLDASSDDSGSVSNVLEYQDHLQSPLQQLQCSLGKDGMLGQKLHLGEYSEMKGNASNGSCVDATPTGQSYNMYFSRCHICTYASNSKAEYDMHMRTHFFHKCSYCDYSSRTEGRLKAHMKNYHSKTPPENWAGSRNSRKDVSGDSQPMNDGSTSKGNRLYPCRQCDFVGYKKNELWRHNKIHIKAEKQLQCEKCDFVTEYKHHYEYHVRNHFGSKPFKCSKCNYSCVNKSMLNSHSKSHSNIYQYRCANCSYATKYCHSLKLHLRKYEHTPATVLNSDGTPNPGPIIDIYGTRRGPRTKKRKSEDDLENGSGSSVAPSQQTINYPPAIPFLGPGIHTMFPTPFLNGYPNVYINAHQPADNAGYHVGATQIRMPHDNVFKCNFCIFTTDQYDIYQQHIIKHAVENKDLMATMGITPDSLHFHDPQIFNNYTQRHLEYAARAQRDNRTLQDIPNLGTKYELEYDNKNIKEENGQNLKIASPQNDSRQELSPVGTNASDTLSQHENQERCSSAEREKSVIVMQTILPSSAMEPQVGNETSNIDTKNEHAPLDLSGSKSFDSVLDTEKSEGNGKKSPELKCNTPPDVDTSTISRNRRKGKAFKIDHYMQYDDQSEILNNETDRINCIEHIRNMHNLNEVDPFSERHMQQSLQGINSESGSISPDNIQSVPFKVNSVSISNDMKLLNHRKSPPINQKKHHNQSLPNATTRNSSIVTTGNAQQVKNASTTESVMLPELEANVEQTHSGKKQQEVFKCESCLLTFEDSVMYSLHMGFHGYGDPFTCNMCGQETKNRVDFFIHVQRAAHL